MPALVTVGDCLAGLRQLEPDSIDALVTDPPAGIGLMGIGWDSDKGGREAWIAWLAEVLREALRVMKPGAHGLIWSLPRTSHWTATACELAGFEVRDRLAHLFGTGFPKSLDIAKAVDKRREDDVRPVCRFLRAAIESRGITPKAIADACGVSASLVGHWAARDSYSQPLVPTVEQWAKLKVAIGFGDEMDAEVARLNARKGKPSDVWQGAEILGQYDDTPPGLVGHSFSSRDCLIRAPSDRAKRWRGWGTALKPACEDWWLARKPLAGTTAANVEHFGTGALHIDACRIGDRWPAHVTFDPEAAGRLDAQAPEVSRFFYVAKPSTAEREAGCEGLPLKSAGELTGRAEGSAALNCPRTGAGCGSAGRRNHHPTVKSIALMQWLCRLITPPGGAVLDPFCGSGSTGCAAVLEGFDFIGFEQDPAYAQIARARIAHWSGVKP